MNSPLSRADAGRPPGARAAALLTVLALAAAASAAAPKSDLTPPHKRQASVDLAEQLAARKPVEPLAADLASPFNPADFDKPDPSTAAAANRPGATPTPGAPKAGSGPASAEPAAPPAAAGDREVLETLAAQIAPSGMIQAAGRARLIIKGKLFEIGTRFTVMYKDQEYELELVAIQGNNFTLRYRNEETTRPIKPVR